MLVGVYYVHIFNVGLYQFTNSSICIFSYQLFDYEYEDIASDFSEGGGEAEEEDITEDVAASEGGI